MDLRTYSTPGAPVNMEPRMMSDRKEFSRELAEEAFLVVGKVLFAALFGWLWGFVDRRKLSADSAEETIQTNQPDQLLTTKEACALLKVSRTTLNNLASRHDLGKNSIGGRPKFSQNKIRTYLDKPKE